MSTDANRASSSHFPPLSPISTVAEAGVCTHCGAALRGSYHVINETVACAKCRYAAEEKQASGGFGRAFAYGLGAAVVGGIGYFLFVQMTGIEWGMITALVGIGVGQAVRVGSRSRGGRKYQLLAVLLAYVAMGGAYLSLGANELLKARGDVTAAGALKALREPRERSATSSQLPAAEPTASDAASATSDDSTTSEPPAARATTAAKAAKKPSGGALAVGVAAIMFGMVLLLLAMPILVALGSPISGLIMAFALLRAWRQNVGVATEQVRVAGPFRMGTPPA